MSQLERAYCDKIIKKHTCDCCDSRLPDSFWLDDSGVLHVRFDADHPNDIIDDEVLFTELLGS